jgi:hypothetical protein
MLSEQAKRDLFAQARDDAEKQRLMAAFASDAKTDAMRGLFEHLASLALVVAGAGFATAAIAWTVAVLLPGAATRSSWFLAALGAFFLVALLIINTSMDGAQGASRRRWLERAGRRYGYPITLVMGLVLGCLYQSYEERSSDRANALHALAAACGDNPYCVLKASRFNAGNDVSTYLPPGDTTAH